MRDVQRHAVYQAGQLPAGDTLTPPLPDHTIKLWMAVLEVGRLLGINVSGHDHVDP